MAYIVSRPIETFSITICRSQMSCIFALKRITTDIRMNEPVRLPAQMVFVKVHRQFSGMTVSEDYQAMEPALDVAFRRVQRFSGGQG